MMLAAPLIIAAGCTDFLDVNHSPDAIEEIPTPDVLLPTAQVNLGAALMGYAGIGCGMYVQYWTAAYTHAQFKGLCEYNTTSMGNTWHILYTGTLVNLKAVKDAAQADQSNPAASGAYSFIAEALSIYAWQVITDLFGSVPYSEALQGSANLHPVFDEQEKIYDDLLARINTLLQTDVSALTMLRPQFDVVYGGDMSKWYAFANTLKVKLMLRLSETTKFDLAALKAHLEAASANGTLLEHSARIPASMWNDAQEGKRHPMREYEAGGASYISGAVIACKTLTQYLDGNDDPRMQKLFIKPATAATGGIIQAGGAFFGDHNNSTEDSDNDNSHSTDDKDTWSKPSFTNATASAVYMDLMLMSNWEVAFYAAEVYARSSDLTTAKEWYDKGVKASLDQQGIEDYSIVETNGYAEFTAATPDDALAQIGMQRWTAHANYQHVESFLERNRTKIPAVSTIDIAANRRYAWTNFPSGMLTIGVQGRSRTEEFDGQYLPASLVYPSSTLERNKNAPGQKPNMGRRVWWNQKREK